MEALFGIVGKDFVIVASDMSSIRSIVVLKSTEDRSRNLNPHNVLLYTGEPGDSVQFVEYIQRNIQLYSIRNDTDLNTDGCATFTRRCLADALRTRGAYQTNLLIAGWDKVDCPRLHWIDYISSSISVPYACQGYAGYFCYSTMDRYYRPDMDQNEAMLLIKKCIQELSLRFVANLPNWQIKIIDKSGIKQIVLNGSQVMAHSES